MTVEKDIAKSARRIRSISIWLEGEREAIRMLLHLHFPSSLTFALVVQKQVMMGEAAGTLA